MSNFRQYLQLCSRTSWLTSGAHTVVPFVGSISAHDGKLGRTSIGVPLVSCNTQVLKSAEMAYGVFTVVPVPKAYHEPFHAIREGSGKLKFCMFGPAIDADEPPAKARATAARMKNEAMLLYILLMLLKKVKKSARSGHVPRCMKTESEDDLSHACKKDINIRQRWKEHMLREQGSHHDIRRHTTGAIQCDHCVSGAAMLLFVRSKLANSKAASKPAG